MRNSKRTKELRDELKDWLGKDWRGLSAIEQEEILGAYDNLTQSRVEDPMVTIRKISDREFNYVILIIGSLYGVALSLLADSVGNGIQEYLGNKGYFALASLLVTILSLLLVTFFIHISRVHARHLQFLEALRRKARELKTNPDVA